MQFGPETDFTPTWHFDYPCNEKNLFTRRLANANFISEQVRAVEEEYSHLIFIHISMQFGYSSNSMRNQKQIWTFPMFLTPSYLASGEIVPQNYIEMERLTLSRCKNILTPSHLEKRQLTKYYTVPKEYIHVVPRGIDMQYLVPKVRTLDESLKLCSIGSIKPQKNTRGLIQMFAKIQNKYPEATLRIIGPVQNLKYAATVSEDIHRLGLKEQVMLTGYIPPQKISEMTSDAHLHLSASTCETFGRSIFETLALGLPNIARNLENAAAEFLTHLPYVHFLNDNDDELKAIEEILDNLSALSKAAMEIGRFYDDEFLSKLLVAEICEREFIAVSDFDGTLYHKDDPEKTKQAIDSFRRFPKRILCSARPIHDLIEQLTLHNLKVDWIVSYSGSLVTDGNGNIVWQTPLNSVEVDRLESILSQTERIEENNEILQIKTSAELLSDHPEFHIEIYQGTAFIANREASKFRAVHQLLCHIEWSGRVLSFGDSHYDRELLNFFDGTLVGPTTTIHRKDKEFSHV